VGVVGTEKFEARIKELVENLPDLAELVEPLLIVRRTLREQIGILLRRLLAIVRDDEVCRRLMTVPAGLRRPAPTGHRENHAKFHPARDFFNSLLDHEIATSSIRRWLRRSLQ
jgi:hypothetical protein